MFEQLNEFQYTIHGKTYTIYFLKFWIEEREKDCIVKYQIRSSERDMCWYGRMSHERMLNELHCEPKDAARLTEAEFGEMAKHHFQKVFIHVIKKGLDKGFEAPNTEFVFKENMPIERRMWTG